MASRRPNSGIPTTLNCQFIRPFPDNPAGLCWRAIRRQRTKGYRLSQRIRKRIEEIIGWFKTVGTLARTRFIGRWKIGQEGLITGAAYNLLRLVRLGCLE
jgi:hypothetical protein